MSTSTDYVRDGDMFVATSDVEAASMDEAREIAKQQCRSDGYRVRSLRRAFRRPGRPGRWVVVHGVRLEVTAR